MHRFPKPGSQVLSDKELAAQYRANAAARRARGYLKQFIEQSRMTSPIKTYNIDEEVRFTQDWWVRLNQDETKLIAWLKKLHGTEIGGHDDYVSFLSKFVVGERTTKIFTNIALDEKKHAGLIEGLLDARGHKLDPNPPQSEYWKEMDANIVDLHTAAAVNYFGEALAAFRFEVITDHPATPSDVREILRVILPDEQFHRSTLKHIAGDETLARFQAIHDAAVARLKKA